MRGKALCSDVNFINGGDTSCFIGFDDEFFILFRYLDESQANIPG